MEKIKVGNYEIIKNDVDGLEVQRLDEKNNRVGETVLILPQDFTAYVEAYAWNWSEVNKQIIDVLADKKFFEYINVGGKQISQENVSLNTIDFHGLLTVLDEFDKYFNQGRFTAYNWTIESGTDNTWFRVSYAGMPIAHCVDGVLSINASLNQEDKMKLSNTIVNVIDYVAIEQKKDKSYFEIHIIDDSNDEEYSVFVGGVLNEDEALKKAVYEGLIDKSNFLKVDYIDEISKDEYLVCTADFVGNAKKMFDYMSDEYETVNEWKELFYELVADFVLDDEFESIKDIKEKLYELVSDERLEEYILQSSYVNKLENGEFAFNGDTASLANKMKEAEGRSGNAVNRDVYGLSKIDEPVR